MSRFKDICHAYGGISGRELARIFNVSPNTISNIDNPKIQTSWELISDIADLFEVSTGYLMGTQKAKLDQEKLVEDIITVQNKFFSKIKQLELECGNK